MVNCHASCRRRICLHCAIEEAGRTPHMSGDLGGTADTTLRERAEGSSMLYIALQSVASVRPAGLTASSHHAVEVTWWASVATMSWRGEARR